MMKTKSQKWSCALCLEVCYRGVQLALQPSEAPTEQPSGQPSEVTTEQPTGQPSEVDIILHLKNGFSSANWRRNPVIDLFLSARLASLTKCVPAEI